MGYIRAFIGAAALLPSFSAPLLAQGDEPPPAPKESLQLEEVLVTASRRVENLQDVAMSVSAFSGDFFKDSGVNQLKDLEQYTPNLVINPGTNANESSIRIRGIGSVGSNSGIDPSVGLFIDEVYQGRAGMGISDLIDVQRIEVLRGPQGTLYGKNTAAGAISIITNLPSPDAFESMVEVSYDNNEQAELRGMVNVPFGTSGNAMRMTGFGIHRDDLYENTYTGDGLNNIERWGGRSRVLLNLDEKQGEDSLGQLVISMDYTKEDSNCCGIAVMDYNGLSTLNAPLTNNPSAQWQQMLGLNALGQYILQYTAFEDTAGFSPPKADPFGDDYWFNEDVHSKLQVGGVSAQWDKDLANNDTVTFINAWRHYEADTSLDGDFTAYDAVKGTTDIKLDQYSSELRFASAGGKTFESQGGLYAYYSKMDSKGSFGMSQMLAENIGFAFLFPNGTLNIDDNTYTTTNFAAFGQVVWNYSEKLSTTLGLRYTWEKKERDGSQITTPESIIDIPPVAGPDLYYDDSRKDSDASPSINVRYFFEEDIMGYALISRGFKSGGFDQRRTVATSNGEFDPEKATNYELGWKSSWADRRLQLNGTLFYVDYEDFQSQTFDGSSIRVINAGSMQSYGAELELVFVPIADATMGSSLGYNKAEYGSFDNAQCTVQQTFEQFYIVDGAQGGSPGTLSICTQDLEGKPLDNAPEWTVSSYVQYDMALTENLNGVARLEHSYIDSFFLDQDLDPNLKNDAINLVNLRFSLTNAANDWEVALWGRNLLDEDYYGFGIDIPTVGGYAGVVAPQATYGITVRFYN